MSECPNCGSAKDKFYSDVSSGYTQYVCRSGTDGEEEWASETCDLIRSLREELAEERNNVHTLHVQYVKTLLIKERIEKQLAEARDAERDQIADWLELRASKLEDELAISETSTEIGLERMLAVIKSLRKEAQALRNNEHRSDT